VFVNKVLGRVFGPTREEVTGGSGELHNEEVQDRTIKSRRMRWPGAYSTHAGNENKIFVVKPRANRPLRRPIFRRQDDIRREGNRG
jgi:hypothetical protein